MAAFAVFLAAAVALAGPGFTLVVGGKITSVEAIQTKGGTFVHARAAGELARAAGYGLTFDPGSGVVSLARGGADVQDGLRGFKAKVTFVVDGKIVTVASRTKAGVPYVAAKDLAKVAEAMGFTTDLEGAVLAVTPGATSPRSGGVTAGQGGGGPGLPAGFGPGSDLMDVVRGAAGATGLPGGAVAAGSGYTAPAHDGSVCGYLDSQKSLWLATEPSALEKETVRRLADLWSDRSKGPKGNPADLEHFERTLKGFNVKVQARLQGTRDSSPPAPAQAWHQAATTFVQKTSDILALAFDMIRVMKLPPDKQAPEVPQLKENEKRIKQMETEHKALGTRANEAIFAVRERHGCGPP